MTQEKSAAAYLSAGVDIDAGNAFVERLKPLARATATAGVVGGLGGFGGVFDPARLGFTDPLLVAATDGVGTKLLLGRESGRLEGLGVDLVAMCVNDLVVQGAQPLFFLDYYATGRLEPDHGMALVQGIAAACTEAGCALLGGETAEMPGVYPPGEFDLAGFAVGAVERGRLLPRTDRLAAGDQVIGLVSSGIHSNGYSLVRRILEKSGAALDNAPPFAAPAGASLADELMRPTRVYVRPCLELLRAIDVKALVHVTGGGLVDNPPRVLTGDLAMRLDLDAWTLPPVFAWLAEAGGLARHDLLQTFNCGLGMLIVIAPDDAEAAMTSLAAAGEMPRPVGEIVTGDGTVDFTGGAAWPAG